MVVSIPKGFPTKIQADKKALKGIVIYYQLKSLYVGGTIHNYRKRYQELADTFGISSSNLRSKISLLKEFGLAKSIGTTLFLRSKSQLIEQYGTSKKCYKIECTQDFEAVLLALACAENIEQQKYRTAKKIVDHKLKESKDKPKGYIRQVKRYVRDNFDSIVSIEKKRFQTSYINPFFTLSRKGIARVINRKSKSTGQRWAKKFISLGLLKESSNLILFKENANYNDYLLTLELKDNYKLIGNRLFIVKPNNLRFQVSATF